MKKILVILIIFSVLFVSNKVFATLGCYNNLCLTPWVCDGKTYKLESDLGYKQCLENEKAIKEKLYTQRTNELSQYSDFFEKVGVSLTLNTSSEEYNQWLKELKEAKANYIKDQENQQKIKELEERINNLESKPAIVEKVIIPKEVINATNKEEVIKPIINNKIVKPIIKKEEPKKEILEEKPSTIIEPAITTEPPTISTNQSFFQRVFNWFKSLL